MRRILVIDDEAQIRRLLEITLSNLGWEVFTASTGLEGLEAARGAKPELILLDLNLPTCRGPSSWCGCASGARSPSS